MYVYLVHFVTIVADFKIPLKLSEHLTFKVQNMSHDFLNLTSSLQRVYSDRIALRPVSMADGWPLFEATKNPLFNKYLMWSRPKDATETLERIDMIADAVAKGQMSAVSVVLRSTGEWIGLFRFQPYRQFDDTLEIGFWSRDTFWQGRFGIEVGVLCVAAAFKLSTVSRIVGASSARESQFYTWYATWRVKARRDHVPKNGK